MILTVLHRTKSSANKLSCDFTSFGKSLMLVEKRIGPSTEPWGTSVVMSTSSDTVKAHQTGNTNFLPVINPQIKAHILFMRDFSFVIMRWDFVETSGTIDKKQDR